MSAPAKPYLGRRGMSVTAALLRFIAAVAVVVAVALPINQLTQPGGDVPVVPAVESEALDLPGLPEGVFVTAPDGAASLHAGELPVGLRALTELPSFLTLVAIASGTWWLAKVLDEIRAGRPFDRHNPGRLAGVAAAVVVGGLVVPVSEGAVTLAVLAHLGLTGPESPLAPFSVTIPFTPIGVALLLLAAAEAFRRGAALDDDVRGLV